MNEQDIIIQEQIKEIVKQYLIDNLKIDINVENGYYADDSKYINVVVTIEEEVISSVTEQI